MELEPNTPENAKALVDGIRSRYIAAVEKKKAIEASLGDLILNASTGGKSAVAAKEKAKHELGDILVQTDELRLALASAEVRNVAALKLAEEKEIKRQQQEAKKLCAKINKLSVECQEIFSQGAKIYHEIQELAKEAYETSPGKKEVTFTISPMSTARIESALRQYLCKLGLLWASKSAHMPYELHLIPTFVEKVSEGPKWLLKTFKEENIDGILE